VGSPTNQILVQGGSLQCTPFARNSTTILSQTKHFYLRMGMSSGTSLRQGTKSNDEQVHEFLFSQC
jgi:hypothetical protein